MSRSCCGIISNMKIIINFVLNCDANRLKKKKREKKISHACTHKITNSKHMKKHGVGVWRPSNPGEWHSLPWSSPIKLNSTLNGKIFWRERVVEKALLCQNLYLFFLNYVQLNQSTSVCISKLCMKIIGSSFKNILF